MLLADIHILLGYRPLVASLTAVHFTCAEIHRHNSICWNRHTVPVPSSLLTSAALRQTTCGCAQTDNLWLQQLGFLVTAVVCPSLGAQTALLLCRIIKEAFYLARTGRPGPVLVDVPKDIQQQLAVPDWSIPMAISGYMSRLPQPPQERELKRVIEALHGVRAHLLGAIGV